LPRNAKGAGAPLTLEVGRVDHQPFGLGPSWGQFGEDPIEHAQPAPADEATLDRFVRSVILQRIAPARIIPDDKNNTAEHLAVINPKSAM
jgi:hypothetical protein